MLYTDSYYAAALQFVNEIRARYHMAPLTDLRPGYTCSASSCVISESLRDCSVIETISTTPRYTRVVQQENSYGDFEVEEQFYTPELVNRFIGRFDDGEYNALRLN